MLAQDREYVERVLSGETEVFERLVSKYNRLGGAIAYGVLRDFQLAEDVVQDAFLKAYRSLGTLRQPERFQVWFSGIVKKRAIDVLRQRRSFSQRALSLDSGKGSDSDEDAGSMDPSDDSEPLAEQFVRAEKRQKILEAIESLSESDRSVVVLKHMEALSYREIATLTGSTVAAVESRLFRARQILRRKLNALLKTDSRES